MDGFRGDMRGLEDLRRRMEAVASGQLRRDVFDTCGLAAEKVLDDEFRTSTDPYGVPWAPLTSRVGKPLLDTRTHLQLTLHARTIQMGFVIETPFVGAAVHQYGAVIRPKNGKALAFKVRGAPTKRSKRGKAVQVFAQEVTIPRRQYMPEGDAGPRWTRALNDAATAALWQAMGRDF